MMPERYTNKSLDLCRRGRAYSRLLSLLLILALLLSLVGCGAADGTDGSTAQSSGPVNDDSTEMSGSSDGGAAAPEDPADTHEDWETVEPADTSYTADEASAYAKKALEDYHAQGLSLLTILQLNEALKLTGDADVRAALHEAFLQEGDTVTARMKVRTVDGKDVVEETTTYEYDRYGSEGKLTGAWTVDHSWMQEGTTAIKLFHYNAKGLLLEIKEEVPLQEGGYRRTELKFGYREDGSLGSRKLYDHGLLVTLERYDTEGQRTLLEEYNGDKKLLKSTRFSYGADGTPAAAEVFDGNGNKLSEGPFEASEADRAYVPDPKAEIRPEGYRGILTDEEGPYTYVYEYLTSFIDYEKLAAADVRPEELIVSKIALRETKTSYSDGSPYGTCIKEYDGAGNVLHEKILDGVGTVTSETIFAYDANGELFFKGSWQGGRSIGFQLYEYDGNGRVLFTHLVLSPLAEGDTAAAFKISYEYDDAGREIRAVTSQSDTYSFSETLSTYNEKGLLVRSEVHSDDGSVHVDEFSYDDAGNRTVIRSGTTDGEDGGLQEYTYDASGRMTAYRYTYGGQVKNDETYEYDAEGREILQHNFAPSKPYRLARSSYDGSGRLRLTVYYADEAGTQELGRDVYNYESGTD